MKEINYILKVCQFFFLLFNCIFMLTFAPVYPFLFDNKMVYSNNSTTKI